MLATANNQIYSRDEVCRVLSISQRQLRGWEKQKLIHPAETFGFSDLLALRTIVKLRQAKIPAMQIHKAVTALRNTMRHVVNPLTELKIFAVGKKIRVEADGRMMEPVSGQLLLDFKEAELKRLLQFPTLAQPPQNSHQRTAERWFEKGLELEQTGAPVEEIVSAYEQAVSLDPQSAGALVNLGTIYFNTRSFAEAERCYKKAIAADPNYALAHFNLGNLHDERGDRTKALLHYSSAVRLNPGYADAHYNIALLFQSNGEVMKAMRHWKTYLKLDPGSSWAVIARRELDKLRDATLVRGTRL